MKQRINSEQSNSCRICKVHRDAKFYYKFNIPHINMGQSNVKQNIVSIKIGGGIPEAEMKGSIGLKRKQHEFITHFSESWACCCL